MESWCVEGGCAHRCEPEPLLGEGTRGWDDDEPLFGECGEAKLMVSSGARALFKWKGKSCSNGAAGS